jgi:hypothetical protein
LVDQIYFFNFSSFFSDYFLLQFSICYLLYSIYINISVYYSTFYFTLLVVFFGLFLAVYQLDLFTAFLWLAEFVVIFIVILFIFFLNVYSNVSKKNKVYNFTKYLGLFFLFIIISQYYSVFYDFETLSFNFFTQYLYDNFYDHISVTILNDFFLFFKSYYYYNSLEFLLIGFLLLVGSLICVNLNFFSRNNKVINYYDFFIVFDFFKDFSKFVFMRKQNLNDQLHTQSATRIFKKKV